MLKIYLAVFFIQIALAAKPNFVFILSDDQDFTLNGLLPMKQTLDFIGNQGATFQHAYVNSPICCPSRSTILTGRFQHNTYVFNNSISGNCSSRSWQQNLEPFTVSSILNQNGYNTFYAGKYLNEYGHRNAGGTKHIPQGYNSWIGLVGNSKYYNYSLSVNGTKVDIKDKYLTDVLADYSTEFIENQKGDKPFFMMVAPPAPHAPFTPADRHKNSFPDVKVLKTPAFNYTPEDKHWLLQLPPRHLPRNVSILDDIYRKRWQTLLSVDDLVLSIVKQLEHQNLLDNTYIIFSSDNGYHMGQFGQPFDKRQLYETDIRIPLLIRGPDVKKKILIRHPVAAVDFAPTILDLASIPVPIYMDGVSFKKVLLKPRTEIGDRVILIEYRGEGNAKSIDGDCPWKGDDDLQQCTKENWCKCEDSRNNSYSCIRHINADLNFKFCKFHDDLSFTEIYNLTSDPYELVNLKKMDECSNKKYKLLLQYMKNCSGLQCQKI